MALPYEERGWDPDSQPWNVPKKQEPEDDDVLVESMVPSQPIDEPAPLTIADRILSEVVEPTEEKIRGVGIGINRSMKWADHFERAERKNGLPRGSLISIASIESMGDPGAGSDAGARGLMQFMPKTARWLDLRVDEEVDERLDPVKSIEAAGKFFGDLVGGSDGDLNEALMKYNWGSGHVSKWKSDPAKTMPMETRQYIGRWNAAMRLHGESTGKAISSAP
tara:strand:+ start:238 stop:903 length:666 start_codon:yes stop_codon:yes gene_type:complete